MNDKQKYAIKVAAKAEFLPGQSDPDHDHYVFAYHITVTNVGQMTAQLLNRHWIITDGAGHNQEVKGDGVVGEQPRIAPGESYRYTSGCTLPTPVGTMHGHYGMRADDGHEFDAPVEAFTLAIPRVLH